MAFIKETIVDWKHGYYAESGYTYGHQLETMPRRLHWAALLQGHTTPLRGFRYLDAGCGQGINLLLAAAAHPDSEFVGIDFMPDHIAHATRLAEASALSNVTFIEGDFTELAQNPAAHPALIGQFDYVICHGVTTWISPTVKQALFALISKVLRPAGLLYNSYNTFPGWLATSPLQHLVLLEQRTRGGHQALAAAEASLNRIRAAGLSMFSVLPALSERLDIIRTQDPAYLIQEYNNQHWQPVYFSQMHDELAAVKLSYLGTATLTDAFGPMLSEGLRELLAAQDSLVLREQLRDYAVNQTFRRDLYVKGRARPWGRTQRTMIDGQRFIRNPIVGLPAPGQPFAISGSSIHVHADPEVFGAILNRIESTGTGTSMAEVLEGNPERAHRQEMIQAVSLLLQGGWIVPAAGSDAPEAQSSAGQSLNRQMAMAAADGAPYTYMSLPKSGAAMSVSEIEWLLALCCLESVPRDQWAHRVAADLGSLNHLERALTRGGRAPSAKAVPQLLEEIALEFEQRRLPFYRNAGAL